MHKQGGARARNYHTIYRIYRLEDDWCTPVSYLPLIYHTLDYIDLDPGSTEKVNNEFIQAEKFYSKADDALNQQHPWTGNVYCFPPTYGRCSFNKQRGSWRWSTRGGFGGMSPAVAWFRRLEKDWKMGFVNSALFFTTAHETLRKQQSIWDYPICIPKERPKLLHGRNFYQLDNPLKWGFFVFLPPKELGFTRLDKFEEAFSTIGRVIL